MKLLDESVPVLSNVKSLKTAYSFSEDAQDAALAIDVITNKGYKYKIQTPVQEYICNARDAHRESGQTRPIEITLPTVLDPIFKVRDFGNGISPENMTTVFTKFFASTKRRDNNQTGGFGLGAKSAWAYTDSFGIVSITDGVKRSYTAYKSGQGMLQPEGEEKTTELSGLEISIGVNPKDVEEFRKAVTRSTFFWKESERPHFVNNKTPVFAKEPKMFDRLAFYDSNDLNQVFDRYSNSDFVLLDGIPYQLQDSDIRSLSLKEFSGYDRKVKKFFLVLNTGEISVTPFREGLEFNDFTNNALNEKLGNAVRYLSGKYTKELTKAKDVKNKIQVIQKYDIALSIHSEPLTELLTYNNGNIYANIPSNCHEKLFIGNLKGEQLKNLCSEKSFRSHGTGFPISNLEIYEYDSIKDTCSETIVKRKFTQYSKKNPSKNCFLMIFRAGSDSIKKQLKEGLDFLCTSQLSYEKTIPKVREARKAMEATDLSTTYNVEFSVDDTEIKNTLYVYASDYKADRYSLERMAKFLKTKGETLLAIAKTDENVFIRKGAQSLADFLPTLKFTTKELHHFFKNYEGRSYDYLISMKSVFKNEYILNHINQMVEINKTTKNDTESRFYSIYKLKDVVEADPEYKKMLTIQSESVKIISERYSLIENLSHVGMSKETLKEIQAYITAKDQGE